MGPVVGIAALALAGVVAVASRDDRVPPSRPAPRPQPVAGPPGRIVFPTTTHDFGRVRQGDTRTHVFEFRNDGAGPLRIVQLVPHCGCLPVLQTPDDVPPGGTGRLAVTLQTAALLGRSGRTMDVHSSDPAEPVVRLTLWSDVWRPYAVEPEGFELGELARGERAARAVAIRSLDGSAFAITGHSPAPDGMAIRVLPADPAAPGRQQIELTVLPEWTAASALGRVRVDLEPPPPAPLWIPYRVSARQPLAIEPWQARFGRVAPGARPAIVVRLRVLDGAPVTLTDVAVQPEGAVTVATARDRDDWVLTLVPGPAWPAQGTVSGHLRIATDRFPTPVVVPFEGVQLAE